MRRPLNRGSRSRRLSHAPIRPSRPVGRVWRGFAAAPWSDASDRRLPAVSRRSSKSVPSQVASRARRFSGRSTSGGSSGTCGGRMLAIGDALISPSSTSHL